MDDDNFHYDEDDFGGGGDVPLEIPSELLVAETPLGSASRLYVSLVSAEGLDGEEKRSCSSCLFPPSSHYCMLEVDKQSKACFALPLSSSSPIVSSSSSSELPISCFDVFEYYGPSTVGVRIERQRCSLMGRDTKVLGSTFIRLADIVKTQRKGVVCADGWGYCVKVVVPCSCAAAIDCHSPLNSRIKSSFASSSSSNNSSSTKPLVQSSAISKMLNKNRIVCLSLRVHLVPLQHCLSSSKVLPRPQSLNFYRKMTNDGGTETDDDVHDRGSELHFAAALGSCLIVLDLMNCLALKRQLRKALCERTSNEKMSVLEVALLHGHTDSARALLTRAGNYCFQGQIEGAACPLHYAIRSGNLDCLNLVLRFLRRYTPEATSSSGWDASFQEMLEWKDANDDTPLLLACSMISATNNSVWADMVNALIDEGCSVGALSRSETPLMRACQSGNIMIVERLLEISTNLNTLYVSGQIKKTGNPLSALLCSPCAVTNSGEQALSFAAANGHVNVIEKMHALGVPLAIVSNAGDTLLHLAAFGGHEALCDFLIEKEKEEWKKYQDESKGTSLSSMQHRDCFLSIRNAMALRPADVARIAGYHAIEAKLNCAVALACPPWLPFDEARPFEPEPELVFLAGEAEAECNSSSSREEAIFAIAAGGRDALGYYAVASLDQNQKEDQTE